MKTQLVLWCALGLALTAVSCSTGNPPPRPGTPAFYWASAVEAYRAGDFPKVDTNLQEVLLTDNEFTARARPWEVVISAGLAKGYAEMADTYDAGARANRANPMPFHKQVTILRSLSGSASLQFAATVRTYLEKDHEANVPMTFPYPAGSAAEPTSLRKVATGMLLQDSERDSLQLAMEQRGVVMGLAGFIGSPGDTAKTVEQFKAADVKVPRTVFLFAAAKALQDQSEVFSSQKLDQPGRLKVMCDTALAALKEVPESKETKALTTRIQAALKKIKAST